MPANTVPIFTHIPDVSSNGTTATGPTLTTAAADFTGVSANNQLVHTSGADGSYVRKLRFKAVGSNIQTVARVYLNNGADPTVAANNILWDEVPLPATTAGTNAPTGNPVDLALELALPTGWRIYVGLGVTVAAGWDVTAVAGQY